MGVSNYKALPMKYFHLIIIVLLISCKSDQRITAEQEKEFATVAQQYQTAYMNGGTNCEEILSNLHEDVQMWEGGKTWTYSDLEQYCSYLPIKSVITTYNDQYLLDTNRGYDFVSQLYISQQGDTIRETTSRIWEKEVKWKIVKMNNLLSKER